VLVVGSVEFARFDRTMLATNAPVFTDGSRALKRAHRCPSRRPISEPLPALEACRAGKCSRVRAQLRHGLEAERELPKVGHGTAEQLARNRSQYRWPVAPKEQRQRCTSGKPQSRNRKRTGLRVKPCAIGHQSSTLRQ